VVLAADRRLSSRAERALRDAGTTLETDVIIPVIVLAEAATIIERRKVDLDMNALLEAIDQEPYHVVPLDVHTFREMLKLPSALELHDRVIAATARLYGAKVVTRDAELTSAVDTIW
jgi:predicted nucleic acid-binding protein